MKTVQAIAAEIAAGSTDAVAVTTAALDRIEAWQREAPTLRAAGSGTLDVLRGIGYLGEDEDE